MRTRSVYDCKESTDPAPANSLSPHLPPIFGEFLYFHLLIGLFILAYINVNTGKNFYSHTPHPAGSFSFGTCCPSSVTETALSFQAS